MSIKVKENMFRDCGFDPRFNFKGDLYESHHLKNNLMHRIYQLNLIIKAYLSLSSRNRKIFKAVMLCSRAESRNAKNTKLWAVQRKSYKDAALIKRERLREYDFLEHSSKLCKILLQLDENAPARLFPCEILQPIHAINKPQEPWAAKENIMENNSHNADLARLSPFGFSALSSENCSHKEFIEATEVTADCLKHAIRSWRIFIYQSSKDIKNYKEWKERSVASAVNLHQAWNAYAKSHDLVQNAQQVFSHEDSLKNYYVQLKA